MAARRARGGYDRDGVRLLRPGVWELRFSLGPDPVKRQANGRPVYRQKSVTFVGSKTEARAERARLMAEMRPKAEHRTDYTFSELFEAWLSAADLQATTALAHRRLYSRHVGPAIGDVKLRELGARQLEDLYATLHRPAVDGGAGLHERSVRRIHAVVNSALKRAVAWEWLDRNPAEFARPPRIHGRPETYTPTLIELQRAFLAAAEVGDWALAFVWCAAATGMRRGELCGLQWADVDGAAQVIHVRRAVVDVGGKPVEKAPKTGRGRVVEVPAELVAVLAAYQAGQVWLGPWLWSSTAGATRVHPDKLTASWNAVKERAGIPAACRLHDLRHAYGSILAQHGGEGMVAAIAAQLGHGDMSTTMRHYISSLTSGRRAAADAIGALLAPAPPENL